MALLTDAVKLILHPSTVPEAIYEHRLAICHQCPSFQHENTRCKECNCYMHIKARFAIMICQQRKWVEYRPPKE
jgi:hypothetical protein